MSLESQNLLFQFLSFAPGPFWFLLLFAPKNQKAMRCYDLFLVLLSVLFTLLTIPEIPKLLPILAMPTLESINLFLGSTKGTLGAWNHMILADLWIGRWVFLDSLKNSVSFFPRLIFLLIILFFGPLGFCFYFFYRLFILKRFALTEEK